MAFKKLKLWFDKDLAKMLMAKLEEHKTDINTKLYIKKVDTGVKDLELKARVELMADEFETVLGNNYKKNIKLLSKIYGPENEEETGMFSNFYWLMPIAKYVEKYGLEHFDISMNAIYEITKRNTSEYTIRPYLEKYPKQTLAQMKTWAKDPNSHVRRLSCEGVRPRLPWASKLDNYILNPKPILPILNKLKDDDSKYVQNSVANCINDIIKDNRPIAEALIEKWVKNAGPNRKWIIKHALRNLKKKEDKWALKKLEIIA